MLEQGPIVVLLWSTFVATLGYLLLRILDRFFDRQVDPRVMHGIWLLLVLRMIIPLRAPDWFAFALSATWINVLLSIWATGCVAMFLLRLWQGYRLRREILHHEVTLPEWLHHDFINIRKKMRIGTRPVLLVTGSHYGPLLSGILRPLIAFPLSFIEQFHEKSAGRDELRRSVGHVLRHELCHLRGGDLWLGWLWVVARAVHWFNPLLAGAGNSLRIWRELACDLRTMKSFELEESDPSLRVREHIDYAQMLLNTAALSQGLYRPLEAAASVVEPFKEIERRISMITHTPFSLTRRLMANSTVMVTILLLLVFSCSGLWSFQSQAVAATGDMPSSPAVATTDLTAEMTSTASVTDQMPEEEATSAFGSSATTGSKDAKFQVLTCVDNTNESLRSLGASGHAVLFEKRPEDGNYLEALALFCGRYGELQAPREDFYLYIMKEKEPKDPVDLSADNLLVLAKIPVPYSKVKRTGEDLQWYQFPTPSIELPEGRFLVAAAFNPHKTKGIYLGIDEDSADTKDCRSLVGLPKEGYTKFDGKGQWMIGAKLFAEPSNGKKVIRLSDAKPAFEEEKVEKDKYKMVLFGGTKSEGQQSYGGAGPVVTIPLEESLDMPKEKLEKCKLAGLCLWASYYGSGFNTNTEKVDVVITDAEGKVLHRQPFPYSKFNYKPRNVNLVFPKPLALKKYIQPDGKLYVGLDPKAHQYKGVYFHYTKNTKRRETSPFGETAKGGSHSGVLVPDKDISPADDREWMIQFFFVPPGE